MADAARYTIRVTMDPGRTMTIEEEDAITEAMQAAEEAANKHLPDGYKAKVEESW